jgi:hypothetical protein
LPVRERRRRPRDFGIPQNFVLISEIWFQDSVARSLSVSIVPDGMAWDTEKARGGTKGAGCEAATARSAKKAHTFL